MTVEQAGRQQIAFLQEAGNNGGQGQQGTETQILTEVIDMAHHRHCLDMGWRVLDSSLYSALA